MILLDLLMFGASSLGFLAIHRTYWKAGGTLESLPKLEPTEQPLGDIATLVVELLRSDEGWTLLDRPSLSSYRTQKTRVHETGVMLSEDFDARANYTKLRVSIKNEAGVYENAIISKPDEECINSELKAFQDRQRDAKQRALTRALASRIVQHEAGVRPVLGGPGVSDAGSDDNSSETATAGLLTYDPATKQVVPLGERGSVSLDVALKARYAMPIKHERANRDMVKRIMDEYDC